MLQEFDRMLNAAPKTGVKLHVSMTAAPKPSAVNHKLIRFIKIGGH